MKPRIGGGGGKSTAGDAANSNSNSRPLSKQAYQLAKTLVNSSPTTAGLQTHERRSTEGLGMSESTPTHGRSSVHGEVSFSTKPNTANPSLGGGLSNSLWMETIEADSLHEKQLEAEIMGDNRRRKSGGSQRSLSMEKNLNQMVKVLHGRLSNIQDKMGLETKLLGEEERCFSRKEIPRNDSHNTLEKLRKIKIVDESEEEIPKSLRELKGSAYLGKIRFYPAIF